MSFVKARLSPCHYSSVLPELLMFSLPITCRQWLHRLSWARGIMFLWLSVAFFSCASRVCEGLFAVSRLHTLFSQISGRIGRFAFVAESWRNKILSPPVCCSRCLFLCILCSRVPKHLIHLISVFLYTNSSFPPLSFRSCFFCLPVSPGPHCISLLVLPRSLQPKINNLCTQACQLFVQKRIWMPFRPGSPRRGKLTNLVIFHNPLLCFSFRSVHAPFFPLLALSPLHPSLKTDLRASNLSTFRVETHFLSFPTRDENFRPDRNSQHLSLRYTQWGNQTVLTPLLMSSSTKRETPKHAQRLCVTMEKGKNPNVCLSMLFGEALSV